MAICNDKFQTASVLEKHNIPTAKSILVFDEAGAKQAVEILGGLPVVVKSRNGSWGRLIAKVNDIEALEAILDHKSYMGPEHSAIVIQEYVEKPGRDIRAFVINHKCIAAIYRSSEHWITNTARGGEASNCELTDEIMTICENASKAVGGGILALDLFETDGGLIVNEINHTMEFKNSENPTGVSISGAIVDYCINLTKDEL
jgi:[lysine-biosynthesis-protein LysW]--L-2-aminoadipate ligase